MIVLLKDNINEAATTHEKELNNGIKKKKKLSLRVVF